MTTRIWLDTTVLEFISKEQLQALVEQGNTLVISNTAVDVKVFQDNPAWVEKLLIKGQLIIECWVSLDEMTAKPFFWSSRGIETPASSSFLDAVLKLPEHNSIVDIAALVDTYGIPRGSWKMGPYRSPAPIPLEDANHLGIEVTTNRTLVLRAAKARNKMHIYDSFNRCYCSGLASQHCCSHMLNTDGSVTKVE